MKNFVIAAAFVLSACLFLPAVAHPHSDLSASEKKTVLADVLEKIAEVYVDRDKVDEIILGINAIDENEPYYLIEDDEAFRTKLTNDLRAVSGDGHLYLMPAAAAEKSLRRMRPSKKGQSQPAANYIDSDILDGNIGYLNIRGFGVNEAALDEIDQEMLTVLDTRALILDLRECRGGGVPAVDRLLNYLSHQSIHFLTSVNSLENFTLERYTQPDSVAFNYGQTVYVLLGDKTFSAGEDFAFSIQLLDRGKLVGKSTRGGGYMNAIFPINNSFSLSVSVGKTFDPNTGKGWQGIGVKADVETPEEVALEQALAMIAEGS